MSNLKLKRVAKALHIITPNGSSVLPMDNESNTNKAVDTLIEFCYKLSHTNAELQKSVMDDELVESFNNSVEPLVDAVCLNIPSTIEKQIVSAISCAPSHLQGQLLKSMVEITAKIYADASEQIQLADDSRLLSKSLAAKANTLRKDLELMNEKLDEPLERVKRMKFERTVSKELLRKGAEQGDLAARAKYGTIDQETLETAAAINKAKEVIADKSDALDKAIKNARSVSI